MRLVRLEPERWRRLIREAFAFGVVGGLNTVINFAVFNLLILTVFTDGQLKANVAATVVATTTSYFMNRHWTYRDRPKAQIRREYVLFFAFNAAGLLIELAVLGAAKYGFGLTSVVALNVAKAGGVGLGTIFRFWSYRTFVFKASRPHPATDLAGLSEAGLSEADLSEAGPGPAGTGALADPAAPAGARRPAPHPRSAPRAAPLATDDALTDDAIGRELDEDLAAELAAADLDSARSPG